LLVLVEDVLLEQLEGLMDAISPKGVLVSVQVQDVETAQEVEKRFQRWRDS